MCVCVRPSVRPSIRLPVARLKDTGARCMDILVASQSYRFLLST